LRTLTVKLRGRTEAPHGTEGAQSLSARGAKPQAHHGPLQRLLEAVTTTVVQAVISQNEDASGVPITRKQRSTLSGWAIKLPATRQCARIDQTPRPRDFSQTAEIAPTAVGCPRSLLRLCKDSAANLSGERNGGVRVHRTAAPTRTTAVMTIAGVLFTASNGEAEVPHRSVGRATRAHNVVPRPRSQSDHASRTPPAIVRRRSRSAHASRPRCRRNRSHCSAALQWPEFARGLPERVLRLRQWTTTLGRAESAA